MAELELDTKLYQPLLDGMKSLFVTSKYSDLLIHCNGHDFKVHKAVLCSQSTFFAKMLDGDWKETTEGVVNLDDDEPEVVDAMLQFLYTFSYSSASEVDRNLVLHADVYSIADKYDIPQLKRYVQARMIRAADLFWTEPCYAAGIVEVYVTTPASDRGLRDIMVECSRENIELLLQTKAFVEMLEECAPFAADMTKVLARGLCARREPRGIDGYVYYVYHDCDGGL